jgi:hypothetical protein
MKLSYNVAKNRYELECKYEERALPKGRSFWWDADVKVWYTDAAFRAAYFYINADKATRLKVADELEPTVLKKVKDHVALLPEQISDGTFEYDRKLMVACLRSLERKGIIVGLPTPPFCKCGDKICDAHRELFLGEDEFLYSSKDLSWDPHKHTGLLKRSKPFSLRYRLQSDRYAFEVYISSFTRDKDVTARGEFIVYPDLPVRHMTDASLREINLNKIARQRSK